MTRFGRLAGAGFRVLSALHASVLKLTGWRVAARVGGMPIVELRAIGRRSGRARSVVLTAPVVDGDTVVLVASRGGDDRQPAWYRNVVDHPDVELTIGGTTRRMRARVADAAERDALWPRVVAAYGGYGRYQRRTERAIPLVICEPAEGNTHAR